MLTQRQPSPSPPPTAVPARVRGVALVLALIAGLVLNSALPAIRLVLGDGPIGGGWLDPRPAVLGIAVAGALLVTAGGLWIGLRSSAVVAGLATAALALAGAVAGPFLLLSARPGGFMSGLAVLAGIVATCTAIGAATLFVAIYTARSRIAALSRRDGWYGLAIGVVALLSIVTWLRPTFGYAYDPSAADAAAAQASGVTLTATVLDVEYARGSGPEDGELVVDRLHVGIQVGATVPVPLIGVPALCLQATSLLTGEANDSGDACWGVYDGVFEALRAAVGEQQTLRQQGTEIDLDIPRDPAGCDFGGGPWRVILGFVTVLDYQAARDPRNDIPQLSVNRYQVSRVVTTDVLLSPPSASVEWPTAANAVAAACPAPFN